jgi:mRNA-degrading endonuclease RelE of RelBE toxin-antitoxin system
MKYKIFLTEEFKKDFNKCDKSIRDRIEEEVEKLKENPYTGKPLGYKFFREKKIDNYRFYYLIYKSYVVVYIIAISTKKDQQQVIDKIKMLFPFYEEDIKKKFSSEI